MKLLHMTAAGLLAAGSAAGPAFAWTNTNNGHNNQIVDGGPGAQANQHQRQSQSAVGMGGNSTTTNNLSVGNGAAGGYAGRAPDVFLPAIGGGGMDCPTVGFGAGGSGLGGGGGIGPSWISSECNKRKVAELLGQLYGPGVARAYAEQNIDGVRAAVGASATPVYQHPSWCVTNRGVWLSDLVECGKDSR